VVLISLLGLCRRKGSLPAVQSFFFTQFAAPVRRFRFSFPTQRLISFASFVFPRQAGATRFDFLVFSSLRCALLSVLSCDLID
jgi:hypothetical protein